MTHLDESWNLFFGNPLIRSYLTEDELPPEEAPAPEGAPAEPTGDVDQLAADLAAGTITQDDLINMYKAGSISKEDIAAIVAQVENPDASGEGQEMAPGEEEPTEEELLAMQIEQTNDLFVKFSLYDKIVDLEDKLEYFKDNFEDVQSDMYQRTLQLKEFLNILSNLIFSIETAVAYQMYGSIMLQLTELFNEYNQMEKVQDVKETQDDKDNEDYRSGKKSSDPVDHWADKNQSHLMKDLDGSSALESDVPYN